MSDLSWRGWSTWTFQKREEWVRKAVEQKTRERWRAVLLMLKAKLELVRIGISSIEREFLSDLVLPNGRTVGMMVEAQIKEVMMGETPRLLGPAS